MGAAAQAGSALALALAPVVLVRGTGATWFTPRRGA